ncbi:MAG TPA: host attachment protein [Polyangiaceae bacterium]|jgi:protein required for attachment to host cells
MNAVWIVVCDAAKARLFEYREGDSRWRPMGLVLHDESRSKASDLTGDRSGRRSAEGASAHHNALAPRSSPREVEKERFAHALTAILDRAQRNARFTSWVLVAPAHFAGLVKKALTSELEKHLTATAIADLNDLDEPALAERLRDVVAPAAHAAHGAPRS